VASERDLYVLVPDAARRSLLVSRSGGDAVLPSFRGGSSAASVVDAVRREWDLELAYLRPARIVWSEEPPSFALHELDALPSGSPSPPGAEWLPISTAETAALGPPELREAVDSWLTLQRGAPVP
jgi:hypothetical protein